MEIILIKDIENVGYANDIVNVKPGYANNFLIPQGYAKSATASAKKVLAENLRQRAHKDAKVLLMLRLWREDRLLYRCQSALRLRRVSLFGTITSANVAEALVVAGFEIDRKAISLDTIKSVGEYQVSVRLHREVKATVNLSVVAE